MSENVKGEPQSQNKQKAVIKCLTNKGIKPTKIFHSIKVVHGDETMNINKVHGLLTLKI